MVVLLLIDHQCKGGNHLLIKLSCRFFEDLEVLSTTVVLSVYCSDGCGYGYGARYTLDCMIKFDLVVVLTNCVLTSCMFLLVQYVLVLKCLISISGDLPGVLPAGSFPFA